MARHVDYPHQPGTLYDCPPCEEQMFRERVQELLAQMRKCCADPVALGYLQGELDTLESLGRVP